MCLFPHQRTFSYWFAWCCLPFWCLVIGSAALAEVIRLWFTLATFLLAGMVVFSLLAMFLCFPFLLHLVSFSSTPVDAAEPVTRCDDEEAPQQEQVPLKDLLPPAPPPICLLNSSWLLEMVLLLLMAFAPLVPQVRGGVMPVLLSIMGVLFCARGLLLRLTFLWVVGALTLGVILLTLITMQPERWNATMLSSETLLLWGTFVYGLWRHWDVVWWMGWNPLGRLIRRLFLRQTVSCPSSPPASLLPRSSNIDPKDDEA